MHRSNSSFYRVALIIVLSLASFFFSWKTIIPQYKANEIALKKVELETVSAAAKLDSLRVAKKDIEDIGPVFNQLFVAIPSDLDEPNAISEIEAIASANKLFVPSIQIVEGGATGTTSVSPISASASAVTISFAVQGSFEDVSKMTKALENDLKFMNIASITLTPNGAGVSTSYQIEAYRTISSESFSSGAASSSLEGN